MQRENPDKAKPFGVSSGPAQKPLVGIPWRTTREEEVQERRKLDYYFEAVRRAGGEPREISLRRGLGELAGLVEEFDGYVLPGSPADIDPEVYGAARHSKTKNLDENRERTDNAILKHALAAGKPVLGICFGCQSLNVYLKGTLVQDIPDEKPGSGQHGATDLTPDAAKGDLEHSARFLPGSRLAEIAEGTAARINSSHHQAIDRPGEGLRVTATAPDGVVEGVEWERDANWIVGVQWHPERMAEDKFSERLFGEFVEMAAKKTRERVI
jgi:putative glutamine amidotransferase